MLVAADLYFDYDKLPREGGEGSASGREDVQEGKGEENGVERKGRT